MRHPAPPPPNGPWTPGWSRDEFMRAYVAHQPMRDTRYLPWDDLRFRTPPDGLTAEQWWSLLRFHRSTTTRALPQLLDLDGNPFSYNLADPLLINLDQITRGASGTISIQAQVTNPATRDRYVVNSLMEEAITSSQLEGATTSRPAAKEMIRSGRPPRDRSERMILNNFRAMQRISELRDEPLSPELVCELHRIVTEGTLDDPASAGVLQDPAAERVRVFSDTGDVLHDPPPAAQLPERLERLCAFANDKADGAYLPPVLRAVAVHFMCGFDHYFEDGNGRTARALFYWVMLREQYWLCEYLTISRLLKLGPAKYARSFLLTESDAGDLTHFFLFQTGIILRAIEALHEYLAVKADELTRLTMSIADYHGEFNHRQLALLEHAVRHDGGVYSVHSHALSHHVSGETARHDLLQLSERGLLTRVRRGRSYSWLASPDLSDRLVDG